MTEAEKQIGRIKALMGASEDVIRSARKYGNNEVIAVAKDTAYDHIRGIIFEPGYNPWQE